MSHIRLNFDRAQYFTGETIRGTAVCDFTSSTAVRRIVVRFKGRERTKWTEGSGRNSTTYSDSNEFFCLQGVLHNGGTIAPGQRLFPFEFKIPENIPSTFRHKHGSISYSIKATVDREWALDYVTKVELTVVCPILLQSIRSNFYEPLNFGDEKTICCFCCASGNIQIECLLEKRVFCIGEKININTSCKNMSNTKVTRLEVSIGFALTFKANNFWGTKEKLEVLNVNSSQYDGVKAHGEKIARLEILVPPSTILPNFAGSLLFICDPQLKITAVIPGCHKNLVITTNIALYHPPPIRADPFAERQEQSLSTNRLFHIQPATSDMPMPMNGCQAGVRIRLSPELGEEFLYPMVPLENRVPYRNPELPPEGNSSDLDPPTYEDACKQSEGTPLFKGM